MYTELINKLTEWMKDDVVIVADTLGTNGKKEHVTYHGELIQAAHIPVEPQKLFSVDEIIIQTSDMNLGWIDSHISIPTEYIEQIEIRTTEIEITKTNGYRVTITLNQKRGK